MGQDPSGTSGVNPVVVKNKRPALVTLPNLSSKSENIRPVTVSESDWKLQQDMETIGKQQMFSDASRAVEYLANAIGAQTQPKTQGFKSPVFSFTPTESTRDRDMSEMNRQVASATAKTRNVMEQVGMQDRAAALMVDNLTSITQGKAQIAQQQAQNNMANAQRYDDYSNAQQGAIAQTNNMNIEKTMKENQALGAEYSGSMENFFKTISNINRQRTDRAIIKSLASSPSKSNYTPGQYKAEVGLAEAIIRTNTKKDEEYAYSK